MPYLATTRSKPLSTAVVTAVVSLALSTGVFAQTVVEIGAGSMPINAQVATATAITMITGEIVDELDVDRYKITIDDPESFSASTDGHGGTMSDTRLFLFDADGRAVYFNDDANASTLLSTLPPPAGGLGPATPGDYFLAIASYSRLPVDASSARLFFEPDVDPVAYTDVLGPHPGTDDPIAFWEGGENLDEGTYEITITGVNGTLAAQYATYEVLMEGFSAIVQWEASDETNTTAYEVEVRSGDAELFEPQGYVVARGAGTVYTLRVDDLLPGVAAFRIRDLRLDGSFSYGPVVESTVDLLQAYELSDPYPNPFTSAADFTVGVQTAQQVVVEVYDVLGRRVASLLNMDLPANAMQRLTFDGSALPSGVYMIRVEGEHFADTRPVTLLD
jgi:hypothetical protein